MAAAPAVHEGAAGGRTSSAAAEDGRAPAASPALDSPLSLAGAAPSGADESSGAGSGESAVKGRERFIMELEFVQCLANPKYLQFLAQERLLDDPRFIAYLEYLQYWARPAYAKFIRYPQCLHFLKLLQQETFRKKLATPQYVQDVWFQQVNHWWYFYNNRRKAFPAQQQAVSNEGGAAE